MSDDKVSLDGVQWRQAQVAVALIKIDPRLQRPLDETRVGKMSREYSPAALGTLTLSQRGNGDLVCLDGQHRRALVIYVGDTTRKVDAKVYTKLTIQQEALLFKLLNNTKQLSQLVKFRIAVIEGDEVAVACNRILAVNELVAEAGHPNSFQAVVALRKLYEQDTVAAGVTVQFLSTAWGKINKDALDGRIVAGVGAVFAKHGEMINTGNLATRLRKKGTPGALLGEARVLASMRRLQVSEAVADIVVGTYNVGRKDENKLPAWS